jgi:hypothetical protein
MKKALSMFELVVVFSLSFLIKFRFMGKNIKGIKKTI